MDQSSIVSTTGPYFVVQKQQKATTQPSFHVCYPGGIKTEACHVCTSSGSRGRQLYVKTADPFQDQGEIDGFSVSH